MSLLKYFCQIFLVIFMCFPCTYVFAQIKIYAIPFEIETYLPVTKETIREKTWEEFELVDDAQIKKFWTLFNNKNKGKFDHDKIRCLIVANDRRHFIDADGNVFGGGIMYSSINKKQFEEFLQILQSKTNKDGRSDYFPAENP